MAYYPTEMPHHFTSALYHPLTASALHHPSAGLQVSNQFMPFANAIQADSPTMDQPLHEPSTKPAPTKAIARSQLSKNTKKPKRKQVKNACVNCQKACKKCDDGRPCQRCIKLGLTATCTNSARKERKKGSKRGPYRKRSTCSKEFEPVESSCCYDTASPSFDLASPTYSPPASIHRQDSQTFGSDPNKGIPTWRQTCNVRSAATSVPSPLSSQKATSTCTFGAQPCSLPPYNVTYDWLSNQASNHVLLDHATTPFMQEAPMLCQDAILYMPTDGSQHSASFQCASVPACNGFSPEPQYGPVSPDPMSSSSHTSSWSPISPVNSLDQCSFPDTMADTLLSYAPADLTKYPTQQPIVCTQSVNLDYAMVPGVNTVDCCPWQYDPLSVSPL